jgi:methionine-rich copper-binding protein CopC
MPSIRWVVLAMLCVATPTISSPETLHVSRHVHLLRSEPAANDTLHVAPTVIRLWFSQAPELAITTVRLATVSGKSIAVGRPARDTASDAPIVTQVQGAVGPDAYVINWKTTAPDGHPASGQIPFVVRP